MNAFKTGTLLLLLAAIFIAVGGLLGGLQGTTFALVLAVMTPDAFATGRNPSHAAVAVTTRIEAILTGGELERVPGHELAHVFHKVPYGERIV